MTRWRYFARVDTEIDPTDSQSPVRAIVLAESVWCAYLIELGPDGEFISDSWFKTLEKARHHAEVIFHDRISRWRDLPADRPSAEATVKQMMREEEGP